jgi:hypothetical protein
MVGLQAYFFTKRIFFFELHRYYKYASELPRPLLVVKRRMKGEYVGQKVLNEVIGDYAQFVQLIAACRSGHDSDTGSVRAVV